MSKAVAYRPDIDGIRALAVLRVILYHLDITIFKGGYIGVDVFFVISGYLISKIISAEVEKTGSFSFSRFYVNRAKRLLPAFLVTVSASLAFAYALYSPSDFSRFGGELLHALFSVSNFFYWADSGYFDASSSVKPLLHTWSLSVEEQFYLIWPAILVVALRQHERYGLLALASVMFALSFGLNVGFMAGAPEMLEGIAGQIGELLGDNKSTAFFMLPFRVFEFAIGAFVVHLERRSIPDAVREALVFVGLLMVGGSLILIDDSVFFPGYYGLIPCLGTAMIIAGNSKVLSRALGCKPLVLIGLLSYSAYLVHWPLIVFYKYASLEEITFGSGLSIFVATFVIATVMYRLIERPFRTLNVFGRQIPQSALLASCAVSIVALAFPAKDIWSSDGWSWRIDPQIRNSLALVKTQMAEVVSYKKVVVDAISVSESFRSSDKIKVLIVGDSYSADVASALLESDNASQYEVRRFSMGHQCQPLFTDYSLLTEWPYKAEMVQTCNGLSKTLSGLPLWDEADKVVVVARWYDWAGPYIDDTFSGYRMKSKGDVIIFGRKIEFLPTVPELLNNRGTATAFEKYLYSKAERRERPLEQAIKDLSGRIGARYVNFNDIQCNKSAGSCDAFDGSGRALYWDYGHWTVEGIRHFANAVEAAIRSG